MKINDIAKEIARREGKKSQARMGDIKEILGILADMHVEFMVQGNILTMYALLIDTGIKRAKKRNAKKRVKK